MEHRCKEILCACACVYARARTLQTRITLNYIIINILQFKQVSSQECGCVQAHVKVKKAPPAILPAPLHKLSQMGLLKIFSKLYKPAVLQIRQFCSVLQRRRIWGLQSTCQVLSSEICFQLSDTETPLALKNPTRHEHAKTFTLCVQ